MFQVAYTIDTVGEGKSAEGSTELAAVLVEAAGNEDLVTELEENKPSGSEDATFFINRVQKNGGQATYCIFGTDLAAGHHNEKFDVNEDSMMPAVQTLFKTAVLLTNK